MISDIRHRSKTFSAGIALALAGLCLGSRIAHAQVSQPAPTRAGSNQGAVDARGLPPQFISVSNITAQIQVIPHCSRLLKLRGNIVRSFVADPKLIEAVQFGPNELGFVGLNVGSTTVTLWLDNAPEPLVILVECSVTMSRPRPPVAKPVVIPAGPEIRGEVQATPWTTASQERFYPASNSRAPQFAGKTAAVVGNASLPSLPDSPPPAVRMPRPLYDGHASWTAPARTATRKTIPTGLTADPSPRSSN